MTGNTRRCFTCLQMVTHPSRSSNVQNPLYTFSRNFPVDWEAADLLRTCWHADLLANQQVRNKLATNCCNGIWETTRHNRHNALLPAPTCNRLVTDLLRICRLRCGLATGKMVYTSDRCQRQQGVLSFRRISITGRERVTLHGQIDWLGPGVGLWI